MISVRKLILVGALLSMFSMGELARAADADPASVGTALLDRYFAAVNAHDAARLDQVIAADYIQHDRGQGGGRAGMQAAFKRYFETFPDFRMTLEDSIIAGDKVVARFRIDATHDKPVQLGPAAPVFPPTGKKLAWEGISIWRVADGRFVEHWAVDDLLGLAQQMRLPPAAADK